MNFVQKPAPNCTVILFPVIFLSFDFLKSDDCILFDRVAHNFQKDNCSSLHLTQEFSRLYPGARNVPILSRESAPGIVMATGIIGKSLKDNPDVFVSSSAGYEWKPVCGRKKQIYGVGKSFCENVEVVIISIPKWKTIYQIVITEKFCTRIV